MATRIQKIDFINKTLTRGGKKITKKELYNWSDRQIDDAIEKFKDEFNDYLEQTKLIEYLWESETHAGTVYGENVDDAKNNLNKDGVKFTKIVTKKGHHFCKYCGGIATGTQKNILCERCIKMFGHYTYDEL